MKELIYRPQHKPAQELKDDFVIRLTEFDKVMKSIKADQKSKPPQHIIIQGMRGMGKTTLMHRVLYKLQENKEEQGLVPVIFSEEQYSVRKLYKLWEQIAHYLDDHEEAYLGIWEEMEESLENDDYEEKSFEVLRRRIVENKHRLVLLIDNFGVMVDKFSKTEQQRLREILITFPGIKIIGGSAVMLESFFRYDKPFFDFFKVIQLNQLSSDEVRTLLLRLADKKKSDKISEIIEKQPGRLEALRILTGGVPRTIVILFEIFLDDRNGNSIDDLKQLLDEVTPLYKHRMDELPAQQQEIVDKLALNWDGMSVAELSKKTRMESKAVSSQLNVLVKNGVVHAEKSVGKNKYYQLQERFFNIWYLMQHAPRNRQKKVIWLTRFLEAWCDKTMLTESASEFIKRMNKDNLNPEYIRTMTYAYSRVNGLEWEMRDEIIVTASNSFVKNGVPQVQEVPNTYREFENRFNSFIKCLEFAKAKRLVEKSYLPRQAENFALGLIYQTWGKKEMAEQTYLKIDVNELPTVCSNLGLLYEMQFEDLVRAKESYLKGVQLEDPFSMNNLGYYYKKYEDDLIRAEKYFVKAVDYGNVTAMFNLATLYHRDLLDVVKAVKYYLMAIDQGDINSRVNMVSLVVEMNLVEYADIADSWVEDFISSSSNIINRHIELMHYLWRTEMKKVELLLESFLGDMINLEEENWRVLDILKFALIKGLRHFILAFFQKREYQLKDRFKVLYYALMTLMQDEYPNEIKKMGLELKEPVEQMVAEIRVMEKKYSSTEPTPASATSLDSSWPLARLD